MKTTFALWLLNGLWLWLGSVAITSVGPFLFGLPVEVLPQWYWGLSTITGVAGASGLTALVYPLLDRRWTVLPEGVFSCHLALMGDLLEAPAAGFQDADLATEGLEPLDDDVAVFGVELQQPRRPPAFLTGDQGRARARERIEDDIPALA